MYLKRLKTLRIKAGLKQTEIAEILGRQQTVYSRYESCLLYTSRCV